MRAPKAQYLIDSLDPLTWYRAVKTIVAFKPDFVLIPWWTIFWFACYYFIVSAARRRGLAIRFLCHNVTDHETARWKTFLTRILLRKGESFVVHSQSDKAALLVLLPDARITVCPHPTNEQFPDPTETLPRRRGLELLFFGLVRPYKGLDVLIEAMGSLKNEDVFLTIAGEFWADKKATLERIRQLELEDQIEIIGRYVTETEAANLITRADFVVLPYRSATSSGVVPLSYRYLTPVIASQVGGLPEVVIDQETGVLVDPGSVDSLLQAIKAVSRERAQLMSGAIDGLKASMTWERLATATVEAPTDG
ncbi:MAG: glycosyltransferase [Alphaproteobacteria bacterium]|nr:glycosyltransferase [Alphaproteobacteria bacterium]